MLFIPGVKKTMVFKYFLVYGFFMVLLFLRASAMLKHVLARPIGWTSVRVSVRLSHDGIVSNWLNIFFTTQ